MQSKITILSEAWGPEEEKERTAFVGSSGYLLNKLLEEAEITRADCFITNVFNMGYPGGKLEGFCGGKKEGVKGYPALLKSKYVREEYQPELERLANELVEVNPNLIIAMGNTACWALLGKTTIRKLRGTTTISTHTVEGFKVLPTYHPAAIFRQWEVRPTVIFDLMKAKREAEFAAVVRPACDVWISPSIEDLYAFYEQHIKPYKLTSVDIENPGGRITEVGLGHARAAIVIPFRDFRKKGNHYWATPELERQAIVFIKMVMEDRTIKKVMQNGLHDISVMWREWGVKSYGAEHDTMLLHHALQPESLKALGFLGSLYTDHGSWKDMRKFTSFKRDD